MTFRDFQHIQNYFREEERRDPSMTEIRVLDTYWSDHCRHTTFQTELKNVTFENGDFREVLENTYNRYINDRTEILKGRKDKFVCLMDLALMAMRKLKKEDVYKRQTLYFSPSGSFEINSSSPLSFTALVTISSG